MKKPFVDPHTFDLARRLFDPWDEDEEDLVVELCPACRGEGGDGRTYACEVCDDYGQVVNFGRGKEPYRD